MTDAPAPRAWLGGNSLYPLGTDDPSRDVLAAILFGMRIALRS